MFHLTRCLRTLLTHAAVAARGAREGPWSGQGLCNSRLDRTCALIFAWGPQALLLKQRSEAEGNLEKSRAARQVDL